MADLQEIQRSKSGVAQAKGLGREQVTGHSCMASGSQKLIRKVWKQVNSQHPNTPEPESKKRNHSSLNIFGHKQGVSVVVKL